jgi:hypothetical protein
LNQVALDFDTPPLAQARAIGQAAAEKAEQRAERHTPGFSERAQALILEKLSRGPASGEDVTDFVRAVLPMKDGRALGNAYATLAAQGLIRAAGACKRRRGHGSSGGTVWALTTPGAVRRGQAGRFEGVGA